MSETSETNPEAVSGDDDAQEHDVSAADAQSETEGAEARLDDEEVSDLNELEEEADLSSEEGADSDVDAGAEEASDAADEPESAAEGGDEEPHLVAVPEAEHDDDEEDAQPFPLHDPVQQLRMVEALFFAAAEPLDVDSIAARLPEGADVGALIEDLQIAYENRGVNLVRVADKFCYCRGCVHRDIYTSRDWFIRWPASNNLLVVVINVSSALPFSGAG